MGLPLRIALLHPQQTWVESLESMLQQQGPGLDVVMAHTDFDWVRSSVDRGEVDVVLVGVDRGTLAPAHVERLRQGKARPAVVVISESTDGELLASFVRAGVRGWLRPTVTARRLEEVIRGVAAGETWLPHDLTTVVLERLLTIEQDRADSSDALAALSPRELEILDCLARGMTRGEIAARYLLSPHTVRTHINHVLRKLGVHTTLAAVAVARRAHTS
ncbi:MAG: LuxR C-terminal-related transcriptional regulator [Marmoricola sp.]